MSSLKHDNFPPHSEQARRERVLRSKAMEVALMLPECPVEARAVLKYAGAFLDNFLSEPDADKARV